MVLLARMLALAALTAAAEARLTCSGWFTLITASTYVTHLNPGWNAGNTMDAMPTETSWGQPLLVKSTFTNVKNHGFRSVRLPVTWADHFISDAPSFTVDPTWLQRVSDVVDMIISNGMYVIVNAHHDSYTWLDPTVANANLTMMEEKFYSLWYQIGTTLGCKSNLLAFEALNEPSGSSASDAAFLTTLQTAFIKAINDAGGFNSKRVIVLGGMGDGIAPAVEYFQRPASNVTNPWAFTYHYYSPWDFIATAWGDTTWGSDSDKQAALTDISDARGNFSDVPIIIGEFAVPVPTTETAARWKWFDYITRTAAQYGTSVMLWDASGSFAVNSSQPYGDLSTIAVLTNAAAGVENALADNTVDPAASTQWTSAYLFYKQGDPIADTNLPFIWNGATLKSIRSTTGNELSNTAYAINGNNITFKASFMSTLFPSSSASGFKANLTLHFSAGADLQLQAYQWAAPKLASSSSNVTVSGAQNDLSIPVTWQGLPRLAAVKAETTNGIYLIDSWTQWLGPLQQGRLTLDYDYNYDDSNVILTASTLQAVIAAAVSTVFTFEFFPREPDNIATYTMYV